MGSNSLARFQFKYHLLFYDNVQPVGAIKFLAFELNWERFLSFIKYPSQIQLMTEAFFVC